MSMSIWRIISCSCVTNRSLSSFTSPFGDFFLAMGQEELRMASDYVILKKTMYFIKTCLSSSGD